MNGYAEAIKEYAEEEFCVKVRKVGEDWYGVQVENGVIAGMGKSVVDAVNDAIHALDFLSKRREKERLALLAFLDNQKKTSEVKA